MIDDLNAAHENDFDKPKTSRAARMRAEELFEKYTQKGDNATLKAFAAKTLPVIKQHLETAQYSGSVAPRRCNLCRAAAS